jgi:hypothetical protein
MTNLTYLKTNFLNVVVDDITDMFNKYYFKYNPNEWMNEKSALFYNVETFDTLPKIEINGKAFEESIQYLRPEHIEEYERQFVRFLVQVEKKMVNNLIPKRDIELFLFNSIQKD